MIELQRISCEEFKTVQKIPLVVVLDDVRSLNNIGSYSPYLPVRNNSHSSSPRYSQDGFGSRRISGLGAL